MDEILDEELNALNEQELLKIKANVREIESKNWYGMILLTIVMTLIVVSLLIHSSVFGINIPLLIINTLFLIIHGILLYLSKSEKLIAYSGGAIVFIVVIITNAFLTDAFFLINIFLILVTLGCYAIFTYDEWKLKGLKTKLELQNN
ncbi:MAG: hypothetical protein AB8F74_04020 [Saprospiraceae bacterium]